MKGWKKENKIFQNLYPTDTKPDHIRKKEKK